jgi:hypothetical protein
MNPGDPVILAGGQSSLTVSAAVPDAGSSCIAAEYWYAAGNFNDSTNGLTRVINNPAPTSVDCKICIAPPQGGCVNASRFYRGATLP